MRNAPSRPADYSLHLKSVGSSSRITQVFSPRPGAGQEVQERGWILSRAARRGGCQEVIERCHAVSTRQGFMNTKGAHEMGIQAVHVWNVYPGATHYLFGTESPSSKECRWLSLLCSRYTKHVGFLGGPISEHCDYRGFKILVLLVLSSVSDHPMNYPNSHQQLRCYRLRTPLLRTPPFPITPAVTPLSGHLTTERVDRAVTCEN